MPIVKLAEVVRSKDAFGQPVNMNYKGSDTFNTVPGGLMSIFMVFMVIGYTVLKTKYMINHETWSLNNQEVMAESLQLSNPMNFSEFPNVTIGLQFTQKPVILTKEMQDIIEKEIEYQKNLAEQSEQEATSDENTDATSGAVNFGSTTKGPKLSA